jgi:hypothetical protein
MRWPFFFGRGSAAKDAGGTEARPLVRDWVSMPAMQRAVGEPRLTAPTADFVQSLAGTHDPDLSLEPLGHHVSLDAPSGLVGGLARTVETYAPAHELVGRPRPRREAPVQRRQLGSQEADTSHESAAEAEPVPELPTVSFTVIDEPPPTAAPLTRLTEPQAATVLRLAMPRPAVQTAVASPHEPATGDPGALEPGPRPVAGQRLTLGQSRRLGLGAPISTQVTRAVQRSLDEAPQDLTLLRPVPRPEETDRPSHEEGQIVRGESSEPAVAAIERTAPLAGALIQRRVATETGEVDEPGAVELPFGRPGGGSVVAPVSAPAHAAIQRVPAAPLPSTLPRPTSMPTAPIISGRPPLLTVHGAADSTARSGASGPAMIQRASVVDHDGIAAPLPQMVVPHSLPAVDREVVNPAPTSPRSAPLLVPFAPSAQRMVAPTQDFVAYSPFVNPPAPHAAQRATGVIDVPVQREPAAGEAPAPEPSAASAPAATAPDGGVAAAQAPGHSEKELDELARKLHDRISLHLRRDLLIQRERAGMVTDLP